MNIKELVINRGDISLSGRMYTPANETGTCVIFSHGLFSGKDGYKITKLAGDIVSAGCSLITFDFSWHSAPGAGISGISLSDEINDLSAVVEFAVSLGYSKLHLAGSSMGAAVSILFYSGVKNSETAERIRSMILIAPPFDLEELITRNTQLKDIDFSDPAAYSEIEGVLINNGFFLEVKKLNPALTVSEIDIPALCLHGENDSVVPAENSIRIRRISPPGSKSVIIPSGDHNLTDEKSLEILRAGITSWLKKF